MMATLCAFDSMFGSRHLRTLSLAALIADVMRDTGETGMAQRILEGVASDLDCTVGRTHASRMAAIESLRDVMLEQRESARAATLQAEILECWILQTGPNAKESIAARQHLEQLLLSVQTAAAA